MVRVNKKSYTEAVPRLLDLLYDFFSVLRERLATKRVSEDLSAAGSSEQSTVIDINITGHNAITHSGCVSETNGSQSEYTCSDVTNVEISHVNNTTVVNATS